MTGLMRQAGHQLCGLLIGRFSQLRFAREPRHVASCVAYVEVHVFAPDAALARSDLAGEDGCPPIFPD
jgi:hypothetical protein